MFLFPELKFVLQIAKVNESKMGETKEPLDPREFTDLLNQMSLLSQCNELLNQFISSKVLFDYSFSKFFFRFRWHLESTREIDT